MNDAPFDPMGVGARAQPGAAVGVQEWECTYATFIHLSIVGALLGIPVIPTLVMWLIKRERSTFIDDHGKEAMNFQISMVIYTLASGFLWVTVVCIPLSLVVWVGVALVALVGTIQGAIAANHGRYYRYPATLRLLK